MIYERTTYSRKYKIQQYYPQSKSRGAHLAGVRLLIEKKSMKTITLVPPTNEVAGR